MFCFSQRTVVCNLKLGLRFHRLKWVCVQERKVTVNVEKHKQIFFNNENAYMTYCTKSEITKCFKWIFSRIIWSMKRLLLSNILYNFSGTKSFVDFHMSSYIQCNILILYNKLCVNISLLQIQMWNLLKQSHSHTFVFMKLFCVFYLHIAKHNVWRYWK